MGNEIKNKLSPKVDVERKEWANSHKAGVGNAPEGSMFRHSDCVDRARSLSIDD